MGADPKTKTGEACPPWFVVREAIASRRYVMVVNLLAPYPPAELKGLAAPLKALRRELRELEAAGRWDEAYQQYAPLLVAGLMSAQTPAQAVWWLNPRLLGASWSRSWDGQPTLDDKTFLRLLTTGREREWAGDLACRLAEGLRAEPDRMLWPIAHGLAGLTGTALPLTDGYVVGWLRAGSRARFGRRLGGEHDNLTDWLRADPRLGEIVTRGFEIAGSGSEFADPLAPRYGEENEWPKALAALCAEGKLVRAAVIDACAARLLAGDRPGSLRGHIRVHEQLAPTPAEVHERLPTYLGMAASAPGAAAKLAQQALRAADSATALHVETLAGLSADIFSRPETALANQQAAWIDATLKANPDAAPLLLPVIGAAFTHPAVPVQERALKVAAKHLKAAGPDALAALRRAAEGIDPVLRDRARRDFSAPGSPTAAVTSPARAAQPELPAYQPAPMPAALESLDELVTAFTPVAANKTVAALDVERLMEAVALHADRDRKALAEALAPLRTVYPPMTIHRSHEEFLPVALRCLYHAAFGEDRRHDDISRYRPTTVISPLITISVRVIELVDALLAGQPVPVLLATPTAGSGAIDPDTLVARLETYEQRSARPLPNDLQQALIRTAGGDERVVAALNGLPALPGPVPSFDDYPEQARLYGTKLMPYARPLNMPGATRTGPLCPAASEATSLYRILVPPHDPDDEICFPAPIWDHRCDCWPTLLPHHPELLAAHAMPTLYQQANGEDRNESTIFPHFAETTGTPGHLAHLALAYGLVADRLSSRVAAQDALLTLAARGLLRPEQLGRAAAQLWRRGMIRANRLLASLREVEQAGTGALVLETVAAAVEVLAETPDIRGLPDLLLLAARCAADTPTEDFEIPGLARLATVDKPARVGREARRLSEALRS